MYKITRQADLDIEDIFENAVGHLNYSVSKAEKYEQSLYDLFDLISSSSGIGELLAPSGFNPSYQSDIFEIPFISHIVIYSKEVTGSNIVILRVLRQNSLEYQKLDTLRH